MSKFFGFSRTETNAFVVLLPILIVVLFSEPVYRWWLIQQKVDFQSEQAALDSMIAQLQWAVADSMIELRRSPFRISFHSFDPNVSTETDFKNLGLPVFLARRLVRFREKGGTFRKKEDLLKIYGMDSSWYRKAEPWIAIQSIEDKKPDIKPLQIKKGAYAKASAQTEVEHIDINLADSLQLLELHGIGPTLSKRIRSYRDKLGGFVSLDQLKEVYGLDSGVVKNIREMLFISSEYLPARINLNTATLEEFQDHPYFRRNQGRAILTYRQQHGLFQSLDDLHKIQMLQSEWIDKIKPYLRLE